jgi:hypothetical protein
VAVTSERAGEYRRQARERLAVARTVVNAQARASLEAMAQVWLRLADQLEPPGLRPPPPSLTERVRSPSSNSSRNPKSTSLQQTTSPRPKAG